jgi:hypothetical protein
MQLAATRLPFACDWRPLGYNLHAASCVQSRQFFASTLREQLFELKNLDAIKKSENLRDTCACKGLSINTMHGPVQSRETGPLMCVVQ